MTGAFNGVSQRFSSLWPSLPCIFGLRVAGCTASTLAIYFARRAFQLSPPAASAIGIATATVVSSAFLTAFAFADAFVPVSSQPLTYGNRTVALLCAFEGAAIGGFVSTPIALIYCTACFVRQWITRTGSTRMRPMRRSKWQLAFTLVLVVFSAFVAIVTYPNPTCLIAVSMGVVASMGNVLRVGWFVPCIVAGVDAGVLIVQPFWGGSIQAQMLMIVASISVGATVGCIVGVVIDSSRRSELGRTVK